LHDKLKHDYIHTQFENIYKYISIISKIELLSYPKITQIQENAVFALLTMFSVISLNQKVETATILLPRRINIRNKIPHWQAVID
jgi:hypothetical protein